jgi:hypothetical protein
MSTLPRRSLILSCAGLAASLALPPRRASAIEQRNDVGILRGPYNEAFYYRHNESYRIGAAMHFFHSKQHDLMLQTPFAEHARYDQMLNQQSLDMLTHLPRTEPAMQYYSELADRTLHTLFRAIDWTHMHHEQTYDIMSDRDIAWAGKKRWTDRAVRYYLTMQEVGVPRSVAPLDVTMRRSGVMMKPYFTLFRNYYPLDSTLFYVAHWWHPAAYESMMIAGNGDGQEAALKATIATMWRDFIPEAKRPQRMVLSREVMPRYSRMTPESANIFDNLHMLHGITYDLLRYDKWTLEQKRDELYRVIHAMGYQPGDEAYVRKFDLPYPDVDPRRDYPWMNVDQGAMSKIMTEMMAEMMPMMMPGATPAMRQRMMEVMRAKMAPGIAPGEAEGSFMDALMAAFPSMKMMPGNGPGETPQMMIDTMLAGWRAKHGAMPDAPGIDMTAGPSLPPLSVAAL